MFRKIDRRKKLITLTIGSISSFRFIEALPEKYNKQIKFKPRKRKGRK